LSLALVAFVGTDSFQYVGPACWLSTVDGASHSKHFAFMMIRSYDQDEYTVYENGEA